MSAAHVFDIAAADEPADTSGFDESGAPFVTQSRDAQRFADGVRLARAFAAIESDEDRRRILALAEKSAGIAPR